MHSTQHIVQKLDDIPRLVEVRDILISEECEIFGFREFPELSFILRESETQTIYIVGKPSIDVIQNLIVDSRQDAYIIVINDGTSIASTLIGWIQSHIWVYSLQNPHLLPNDSTIQVEFLDAHKIDKFPDAVVALQNELKEASEYSLISATFVDNQPVSFCYVASETETLWDISVDTLPDHRRKGYAGLCVAHMIRHMQTQGKQPVWQADEENPASWRLAQKLGFVQVDTLTSYTPMQLN